ncbi:MAG: bifunctional sugar-1-phosphate nucleotidylyltransferase/acetyltransferase [Promethearchaeota archaeon]
MKAVILAAGEGNRLKPITSTRPKPMIPIAGKPLLEHTINGLKKAGIKKILLIVGYRKDVIQNYFKDGKDLGLEIEYAVQKEYLGTAHATNYARDFVNNDPFLLMYGDLLIDNKIFSDIIKKFNETPVDGVISLKEVENPHAYGIITLNNDGFVEKITEKPPPELNLGNLANAGVYIFNSKIFKAIELTQKSVRGEYEFTDSMEILINELGGKIAGYIIKNLFWSDIGLPWQLLEANGYLLGKIERKIEGKIEKNVTIEGNVYIGKNTIVRSGSYIIGPCYIGFDNLIGPNAFIRPNTSIQNKCHIGISEIKNSIILSNTNIPHFNYVGDSIICEGVNLGAGTKIANLRLDDKNIKMTIKGSPIDTKRRKLGAIIGPNVKTGINTSIMCGKIIGENVKIGAHTLVNEDIAPNTLYYLDSKEISKMKSKNEDLETN